MTQKDLAEKLFISDKAVSKWERGISMPDISLLLPLANLLEVTVTELLEGRRLEETSMDPAEVERLVKKALAFSDDPPEKLRLRKRQAILTFSGAVALAVLEYILGLWLLHRLGGTFFAANLLVMEGMSVGFGVYFWFFMKRRLPDYYDENHISLYADGVLRMNIPGGRFSNANWPQICKTLRWWSIASMLALPMLTTLLSLLAKNLTLFFVVQTAILLAYLASLFLPIYALGKKGGK